MQSRVSSIPAVCIIALLLAAGCADIATHQKVAAFTDTGPQENYSADNSSITGNTSSSVTDTLNTPGPVRTIPLPSHYQPSQKTGITGSAVPTLPPENFPITAGPTLHPVVTVETAPVIRNFVGTPDITVVTTTPVPALQNRQVVVVQPVVVRLTPAIRRIVICPDGESLCGSTCVFLQNDTANCGSCGSACDNGVCTGGQCTGA